MTDVKLSRDEARWAREAERNAKNEAKLRERAQARALKYGGAFGGESTFSFDTIATANPDKFSAGALEFRKNAIGVAAASTGGPGVLWVGPAGLEFTSEPAIDGVRYGWDEVIQVEIPDHNPIEERVSFPRLFFLGEYSLALGPRPLDTKISVALTRNREFQGIVAGTTPQNLRFLVTRFQKTHVASHSPTRADAGVGSLERLAALHDAGKLTDVEFGAAKANLLGL